MSLEPTASHSAGAIPLEPLEPGAMAGAYRIFELIGAGGLGRVYRAYDDRLRREVAVKVLRAGDDHAAMLLAEAQTMARLAHPNVVAVYDVGTVAGRPYVAMELVEGEDLRAWLERGPHPWREVVALFVAAGRGLAAAHAAGIVHRDFKPDNVFLGKDGRARVGDFGLAAPHGHLDPVAAADLEVLSSDTIRYSAAIAGTPAYLSPEQHLHEPVDARADQFAFSVALHEGLYGVRPFSGSSLGELRQKVLERPIVVAPSNTRVPGWVRAVVLRGLARDPAARYPNMDAMLRALERDPALRRRRLALGVGLAATSALALTGLLRSTAPPPAPACDGGRARVAASWGPGPREALERAFVASGYPDGGAAFTSVATVLDRHATGWAAMYDDACAATAIRHTQSPELLDLRMACLERRLGALDRVTARLAHEPSRELVAAAPKVVRALDDVAACGDVLALRAAMPPPADATRRARAVALEPRLDALHALASAGKVGDGATQARAALDEARAIAHPPLLARALYVASHWAELDADVPGSEALLREALTAAAAAHDDELLAKVWGSLLFTVGVPGARVAEALAMVPAVQTALVRAGTSRPIQVQVNGELGSVFESAGRYEEALVWHQRAVDLYAQPPSIRDDERDNEAAALSNVAGTLSLLGRHDEAAGILVRTVALNQELYGEDSLWVARDLTNLATAHKALGRLEEALADDRRALAIVERVLGSDHPRAAMLHNNMGAALRDRGDLEEAEAEYRRALEIKEKRLGPGDRATVSSLTNLADVALARAHPDDALALSARALATAERHLGLEHPHVAIVLEVVARAHLAKHQLAPARAAATRGLTIREKALGAEHEDVATSLTILGEVVESEGRAAEALALHRRARAVREKVLGLEHAAVAESLLGEARALQTLRRGPEALTALERAVAIRERASTDPEELGGARLALSRALWDAGGAPGRTRSLALAHDARDAYARLGARGRGRLDEVDRWLARAER